jgi:hypothetical protein
VHLASRIQAAGLAEASCTVGSSGDLCMVSSSGGIDACALRVPGGLVLGRVLVSRRRARRCLGQGGRLRWHGAGAGGVKIWRRQPRYWSGRCCFATVARSDWYLWLTVSRVWPLLWFTIPTSVVVGSGGWWLSWWWVWWLLIPSLPWGRCSFDHLAGRSNNPPGGDAM